MNPLRSVTSSLLLGVVLAVLLTLAVKFYLHAMGVDSSAFQQRSESIDANVPADTTPPPVEDVEPEAGDVEAPAAGSTGGNQDSAPDSGDADTNYPPAEGDESMPEQPQ